MLITRTVTKKILESIVHESFTQFGNLSSSSLLDSLKLLGFHYATTAGVSINIEDLKTPDAKKEFIQNANQEILHVSKQWEQGFISDTERFQSIIDTWNIATESLKNRIVEYYQNFDPANNLYIMAFSGARGNMSQVRQLVGMRGLMSDQEGKIIDLPIQTNFREGLSSIDYIISSYGARKGIVDTALKTADSGYLTRRLIYIAQDLVIRELNCRTKEGVLILLNKNSDIKNLVGRTLNSIKTKKSLEPNIRWFEESLDKTTLKELKKYAPITLNVRSSLTCKSLGSICQKCYGWDLAHEKLISLGEAVGIIAAQSIGEPGTQLTMRTFHTGGIFTGETTKQIIAPFSGKLLIPEMLKKINYRTNHGIIVLKLQEEARITLINWKGLQTEIFLTIGSYLYVSDSCFVKKGQLISEYSLESFMGGTRRVKPIYTPISGEIKWKTPVVKVIPYEKTTININQYEDAIWIGSGKIFSLPKEIHYDFPKRLQKNKSFATLKLISPYKGIVKLTKDSLIILNQEKKITIEFLNLLKEIKNCVITFSPLIKNYQYIDEHTVLGFFEIHPLSEGLIYSLREKDSTYIRTLFFITESDVWKINSDQVNNFSFFNETDQNGMIRANELINSNAKFSRSGLFLKKDGFKMIFQNATPIFLTRGTILNFKVGDFVLEKKIFAKLINYTQQTEDIVQGLPKIEELIEARRPKIKSYLAIRPGILLSKSLSKQTKIERFQRNLEEGWIKCTCNRRGLFPLNTTGKASKKLEKTQFIYLAHSIYMKEDLIVFEDKIYKPIPLPSNFTLVKKDSKNEFIFRNTLNLETEQKDNKRKKELEKNNQKDNQKEKKSKEFLVFHGKMALSVWTPVKTTKNWSEESGKLFKSEHGRLKKWVEIKYQEENSIFRNEKNDVIVETKAGSFLFLEYINPLNEYQIPKALGILYKPGEFIDIGEPFTQGIIDVHELLDILFQYHLILDGTMKGTLRSLAKFQLILVNSVQAIYQSQGVNISSKHIEIIVKQMTSKVVIKESGDTPLLPGELIRISLIQEIYKALNANKTLIQYKIPKYEPILISATVSSLNKDGFLSAAGFQETKRVLTKAAIEGCSDWLRGLKECIIIGRLIPAGSTFLNYKNYLDNIYLFKD